MDTEYIPYPEDPRIGVSKDGKIFNFKTCKILKQHLLKSGYYNVVITSPGIKAKAYRVHRVLMTTFNPIQDMDTLFVNHKDGVKTNNALTNLEWTTPQGNVDHAIDTGLWTTFSQIQIRCNKTEEIVTVKGLRETARKYAIPVYTLDKHLNSKFEGRYDYAGYSFRRWSNQTWPTIISRRSAPHVVKCVDTHTGTLCIFDSIAEAARVCDLHYRRMYHALITKCDSQYQQNNWKVII